VNDYKVAEFSRISVGELVASGEAELTTGPFGTQLKASYYTENGTPVINVRNIGFDSIKTDKLEFISRSTRDRLSSHILKNGGHCFRSEGCSGKACVHPPRTKRVVSKL